MIHQAIRLLARLRPAPVRLAAGATAAVVAAMAAAAETSPATGPTFILVQGAVGEPAYAEAFARQLTAWEEAATRLGATAFVIGRANAAEPAAESDRDLLQKRLEAQPTEGAEALWLVLVGHGTFDQNEARFNLRGDDLTAVELGTWLQRFQRPVAVINTASASAPFLAPLSAPGRVIVTATRSGREQNYTRFGGFFAAALGRPATDLDQDGQVTLLEVFLAASASVDEFYRGEGRLATEHALIDDTGDGLGTPASWFRGLRAVRKSKQAAALDGARAHQWLLVPDPAAPAVSPEWRAQRDTLEAAITALREQKEQLPADEYYRQLEPLLLELARWYQSLPAPAAGTETDQAKGE